MPRCVLLLAVLILLSPGVTHAQGLLRRFMPVERVAVQPEEGYTLRQEHGPWLIMACTFSGDGAQQQAEQCARELRQRLNVNAYVHRMELKLDTENVGRGVDKYGNKKQMKYRLGETVREWAVLVGDFPTVDDPHAQRKLESIKVFEPDALKMDEEKPTFQTLAYLRRHQERFIKKASHETRGPMRTAFITRNPLLPQEYFTPKGVDKFVSDMNRGVRHSLLDMKARYTVKVATFKGKEQLLTASAMAAADDRDQASDPLIEAAENAHLLCERMRSLNIEAYEFHDRHESYVSVGSFEKVARIDDQGRLHPTGEMMPIIQTFGAAYNTPSDPLLRAQLPGQVKQQASQVESQFEQVFSRKYGKTAGGLHPKFARVDPKDPGSRVIPFDIHPHVIEAPKRTVSSSFKLWR